MSLQDKHPFIVWLDQVEEELKWTDNKWTTNANLSASVLSNARNKGVIPKGDACLALAVAANRSPITAFRKAGLLPNNKNGEQVKLEDWEYLLSQMTQEEQEEVREIGIMKIERRKKDQSLKSLKPKKAG